MKFIACIITLVVSLSSWGQKPNTEISQLKVSIDVQAQLVTSTDVTYTPNATSNNDRMNRSGLNVITANLSLLESPVLTPVTYVKNTTRTRISSPGVLKSQMMTLELNAKRPDLITTPTYTKQKD